MDWEKFKEDMNVMTGVEVTEINEMNNEITENIRKSAKKSIVMSTSKVHRGKYNPWWNREIKVERQERKRLNKQCRKGRRRLNNGEMSTEEYEEMWQKYKEQKRKVKHMIMNAKTEYENEKVKEMREKGEEGSKDWYRYLRGDKCEDARVSELMVNEDRVNDRKDIANAIKEFWEKIGNMNMDDRNEREFELKIETKDLSSLDSVIQRIEIERVLKGLKNNKATGMDGIPYEFYKHGGERIVDMLWNLFREVWREERVPQKWNESRVILLHKGGHKSKKELKNYRPIALNDTIGKIFCMCLNERVREAVERNGVLGKEQNGFRMNRRGEDNIFIVREMIESVIEKVRKDILLFWTLKKHMTE